MFHGRFSDMNERAHHSRVINICTYKLCIPNYYLFNRLGLYYNYYHYVTLKYTLKT